MQSFKFIDLFCGCGGFSYGLEQAGHQCLLGVDFNAEAIATFQKNHKSAIGLNLDIGKLSKSMLKKYIDINEVDMVVGGPPCQGFSTVGKGDASDARNSLFKQFVRVVKLTEPKVIMFENVTGILAKKNEKTLKNIFASFERLGYHIEAQVLSADDYRVPSRRRRAIIIGVRGGKPVFPKKSSRTISVKEAFKNLNGKLYNHNIELAEIKNKLDKERLSFIPQGRGIRYEKDEKQFLPKRLRYNVDWAELAENRFRQTRLQRIPLDEPAPTILTSRSMYYHPIEDRYLTPREAAKLQSFPNKFVFEGSVTAQFRQIGNAVPPGLGKALGKAISSIRFSQLKDSKTKLDARLVASNAFTYKNHKKAS